MSEAISNATASIISQYQAKLRTQTQVAGEAIARNEQKIVQFLEAPSSAQAIAINGLNSRGGRLDITV